MLDHAGVRALAHVTRDAVIESTHFGRIAVCSPDGRLLAGAGNTDGVQYWRSASKPIQALSVVTSGAADQFELSERELAVCCASHCGSAEHVATVRGLLEKLGLDESALQCGVHWPGDTQERNRLIRADEEPSPLHNNCSGKHAGMLATCLALDADPARYMDVEHPVQRLIAVHLSVLSGVAEEEFVIGRDGCGLPTVAMPLVAMARAYARLVCPDAMPGGVPTAARRIRAAMAAAPEMVSGPGRLNTELLAHGRGEVIVKGGAEGLMCMASAERELGVAFTIEDGSGRAHGPVAVRLIRAAKMEVPEPIADRFEAIEVRNCHDEVVGHIEAADFELEMMA